MDIQGGGGGGRQVGHEVHQPLRVPLDHQEPLGQMRRQQVRLIQDQVHVANDRVQRVLELVRDVGDQFLVGGHGLHPAGHIGVDHHRPGEPAILADKRTCSRGDGALLRPLTGPHQVVGEGFSRHGPADGPAVRGEQGAAVLAEDELVPLAGDGLVSACGAAEVALAAVGDQEVAGTVDGGNTDVGGVQDGFEQLFPFPARRQQVPELAVLLCQFTLLQPQVHAREADGQRNSKHHHWEENHRDEVRCRDSGQVVHGRGGHDEERSQEAEHQAAPCQHSGRGEPDDRKDHQDGQAREERYRPIAQERNRRKVQHRDHQVRPVRQPLPGDQEAGKEQDAMEDKPCAVYRAVQKGGPRERCNHRQDQHYEGEGELAQRHLGAGSQLAEEPARPLVEQWLSHVSDSYPFATGLQALPGSLNCFPYPGTYPFPSIVHMSCHNN
ncbi:hypothetical protein ARTHRO8AJ_120066 [Arthrobacter sp. 8AJ]|nr:hypothetical protein ARTHRO8AJ_120066 [Arthrobacter sp. 8AJ]